MRDYIVRASKSGDSTQPIVQITPESAGWTYIGFEVYRLQPGDRIEWKKEAVERTVIVLEGTCDVTVDGRTFSQVGHRESVFDDASPEAVYASVGTDVAVTAKVSAEIAMASSFADDASNPPRKIGSEDIPFEERGSGSTRRRIRHILDEHHPASKLLLVEVITPAGNWSSYPPHKHDTEVPGKEAYLEETYYYRVTPKHGVAMQRVYDDEEQRVLLPGDGDVVLVPKGYHPVAAPPGFDAYYLNVMAGHTRVWKYALDPHYAHIAPKDGNIMGKVQNSKS